MINLYLFILIFFIALYFYTRYQSNRSNELELFSNLNQYSSKESSQSKLHDSSFYTLRDNYDGIYDDFYAFYYDQIHFKQDIYYNLCKAILSYMGKVYNHVLVVGIKHGGHINDLLSNSMKVTSISKSESVIKYCKYKYSNHHYQHSSFNKMNCFDENQFTQIAIIDREIYYVNNLDEVLYYNYIWVAHKGYVMIQVFNTLKMFEDHFAQPSKNNVFINKYHIDSRITRQSNNEYELMEKIKSKKTGKNLTNIHRVTYYHNDYIIQACRNQGLYYVESYPLSEHESALIFVKRQ